MKGINKRGGDRKGEREREKLIKGGRNKMRIKKYPRH